LNHGGLNSAIRRNGLGLKKEHDDATDGHGCVGGYRQAGLVERPLRPKNNRICANAERLAELLNDALDMRQSWSPTLVETEDAMRAWEANTPREYV
jgi:hypothetical protein